MTLRVAQIRWDRLFQGFRLERLKETGRVSRPKTTGIHREQDVGGAIRTFGLDPLDQRTRFIFDPVNLDSGLLLKIGIQLFIGIIVA